MSDFEKEHEKLEPTSELDNSTMDGNSSETVELSQMNESNEPIGESVTLHTSGISDSNATMPEKKTPRWLFPVVGASIIVIAAILFSIFSPTVINTIARITLSPAMYYQKIENANLEKQIDTLSKSYGNYIEAYQNTLDKGASAETSISATLDSSITTTLGLDGLKNIKASILSSAIGLKAKSTIALACNEKEITTLDYYLDMEKEDFFIQVPDLNKAYIKASLSDATSQTEVPFSTKDIYRFLEENPLTEELLNDLLKKYIQLAIEELDNVTVGNSETVTANKISSEYTKLSVNIDEKTFLTILEKILNTAKSDKDLRNLFVELNICKEGEYESLIQDYLDDIENEKSSVNEKDVIVMTILVDNKGNITGRDFSYTIDNETDTFGYKTARKGTALGVDAWVKTGGTEIINAKGTLKLGTKGASGDVVLSYTDPSIGSSEVFNITMEDVKNVYEDKMYYLNGTYTITSETLSAMNVTISLTGKEKQQNMTLDFVQGGVNLASISIVSKYVPFASFELPKETDEMYDANTQINEYLSTADIQKYLTDINDKIDVEGINTIIDGILYSYSY